jgi:transposase-like protein
VPSPTACASASPRVSAIIDEAREEVLAYTLFHKSHWTQIRSTNPLES